MANLMHEHPNEGYVYDSRWWHDLNVYENSVDYANNKSNVSVEIVVYSDGSAYSQSGSWNGQIWVAGGQVANTTSSRTISNGAVQIAVWTGDIYHNADGSKTVYVEYYVNEPVTSMTRRGANWTLTDTTTTPTVTTTAISNIDSTTATSGGNVTWAGNGTVSARGVCWNTAGTPTTANSKTTDGSGTGSFTSSMTGLLPDTTYYVRAYATNEVATGYGSQVSFKTLSSGNMFAFLTEL